MQEKVIVNEMIQLIPRYEVIFDMRLWHVPVPCHCVIVQKRTILEHEENLIYSGIVPFTSQEAVDEAEVALKLKKESTTTDKEIELLVSSNLQI